MQARWHFIAKIVQSVDLSKGTHPWLDNNNDKNAIVKSKTHPLGPDSLIVQPAKLGNPFYLDPEATIAKRKEPGERLGSGIEDQQQRTLIQMNADRMDHLRTKIPKIKANLKRELQIRKVGIDAMRATRDEAGTKAVEFYRDHEDARRLLKEMSESYGRRKEVGNAEIQMLYSAYLQAGGVPDASIEDEAVGEDEGEAGADAKNSESVMGKGESPALIETEHEL